MQIRDFAWVWVLIDNIIKLDETKKEFNFNNLINKCAQRSQCTGNFFLKT